MESHRLLLERFAVFSAFYSCTKAPVPLISMFSNHHILIISTMLNHASKLYRMALHFTIDMKRSLKGQFTFQYCKHMFTFLVFWHLH